MRHQRIGSELFPSLGGRDDQLLNHYTNRSTGRTTVMHGTQLVGYVDRVLDADRKRGFYYAVSILNGGFVVPRYCESDKFSENVDYVCQEWQLTRK